MGMDKFRRRNQFNGPVTVGYDDTGYDTKLFGATSGAYALWDESADAWVMAGNARPVRVVEIKPIDIRADTNWTAGSHNSACTYALQYGSSGTAGCAFFGMSRPVDWDSSTTASVNVLWSAGCIAAANACLMLNYRYYGVGTGSAAGESASLSGVEASGTGGASAFEYANVTTSLPWPSASIKYMTVELVYTPNTAVSSAGSTFQLNGIEVRYLSNTLI